MRVYFVRHGQSEGNLNNRYQHALEELSAQGQQQAALLAERFKNIQLDLVISSPYQRAKQTAAAIAEHHQHLVLSPNELFSERKRPSAIEHKSKDDPKVLKIKKDIGEHANDLHWHYSDEENFSDLMIRAEKAKKFLESRSEQDILVVATA